MSEVKHIASIATSAYPRCRSLASHCVVLCCCGCHRVTQFYLVLRARDSGAPWPVPRPYRKPTGQPASSTCAVWQAGTNLPFMDMAASQDMQSSNMTSIITNINRRETEREKKKKKNKELHSLLTPFGVRSPFGCKTYTGKGSTRGQRAGPFLGCLFRNVSLFACTHVAMCAAREKGVSTTCHLLCCSSCVVKPFLFCAVVNRQNNIIYQAIEKSP